MSRKKLVAIIVENGNESFRIPLTKGKAEIVEAVCRMAEELTGYNAEFYKEWEKPESEYKEREKYE